MAPPETDLIHATREVIAILDGLNVPYCIGGSLASSVHGIPRATIDGDVVAALELRHCRPLSDALSARFLVSLDAVVQAVHDEKSFNAVHRESLVKVDVFAIQQRGWQESQMQRRQLGPLGSEEGTPVYLASPEDTILAKLDWYRLGGGVSDRQWGDVLGVIKMQGASLDLDYLQMWATHLHLSDLLERALSEGGRK
jgi:hypothetical protein